MHAGRGLSGLGVALVVVGCAGGCGCGSDDDDAPAPDAGPDATLDGDGGQDAGTPERVEDLPIDEELLADCLAAPVDVVYDDAGIPHAYAESLHDASAGLGFAMARDRFLQMELARRQVAGRLTELLGLVAPEVLDSDILMRVLRLREIGERSAASVEPGSRIEGAMEGFACGVNQWIARFRGGQEPTAGAARLLLSRDTVEDWSLADSYSIGVLMAWSQVFWQSELTLTAAEQKIEDTFGADVALDLFRFAPAAPVATMPGWLGAEPASGRPRPRRPRLPPRVLAEVDGLAALTARLAPPGLGGSNAWAVAGPQSASGAALFASDPHLSISSPSIWYLGHLDTSRGEGDEGANAAGPLVAGAPGPVQGVSKDIATGTTTSFYDQADYYLEDLVLTADGPAVRFEGADVPVELLHQEIPDGQGGSIAIDVEWVPHHGPLVPDIVDGTLRRHQEAGPAVSWRWVGYDALSDDPALSGPALHDFDALAELWYARTVDDVQALRSRNRAFPNSTISADTTGRIAWSTVCALPSRDPRALSWDPATGEGLSPAFVLPGGGEAEWTGRVPADALPAAVQDEGFLATANGDPVGVSFDGDPFHDLPYLGWNFQEYRHARAIEHLGELVEAGPLGAGDMQAMQGDVVSDMGARARAYLLEALDAAGGHEDLAPAAERLRAWSLRLAAGAPGEPAAADEVADAVASTIFEAFLLELQQGGVFDEMRAAGADRLLKASRTVLAMLERPEGALALHAVDDDGESVLWDDVETADTVETRDAILIRSLERAVDALTELLGPDLDAWRWGALHRVRAASILPGLHPDIPAADDAAWQGPLASGFPRPGDFTTIDVGDGGNDDLDFSYASGASQRLVVELLPEGPAATDVLPGGQSMDPSSPHFADQMDLWRRNETRPFPLQERAVVTRAERRIRLGPG